MSAAVDDAAAMTMSERRARLLLLSMYPLDRGMWGPTVRITQVRRALAKRIRLDVVAADRGPRRAALARYLLSGRLRGLDGIYVENSTTLPSETDLAFLALARGVGVPVLTYVRDAHYLFDEYYAATSLKRRMAQALFRPAMKALRAVSTQMAYPSTGLAYAVGERGPDPFLLPPGSPAPVAVPRQPSANALLFVGAMRYPVQGLELLQGAVARARELGHDLRVICVSRPGEEPPEPRPAWLTVERGARQEIERLLPDVVATIQPRLRSPYNDLTVPIKVMEYLSYGRPIIATDCTEQARIVRDAVAGIVVGDTVEAMAAGLAQLRTADAGQISRWSANATMAALRSSWDACAASILDRLHIRPDDPG